MSEFSFMEDWDLQAVVRGCTTTEGFSNTMNYSPPSDLFSPLGFDQDEILSNFPDIFQSDGQQKEICKPDFYPQSILAATSSMSIPSCEVKEPEKKRSLSESATPASAMAPKLKRSRKNLQKRVVKHVAAHDLSSDKWAWRKYGQKPIKGSPYPRSYYRCSSLKGCLARKQVERSSADPSIFIITYTAEHSHAYPTRRNSLAGCTRIKQTIPNTEDNPKIKDENSDSLPNSTTTPSMASSSQEDDFVQRVSVKDEDQEEHAFEYNGGSNEFIDMPDIIFSEDLFPSLEDFEGLFLDHFSATVP